MFQKFLKRKSKDIKDKKLIFIIGFNKTGTTSIHRLFQSAGLRSVHWDEGKLTKQMFQNAISGQPILAGYDNDFDVFSDMVYRTDMTWFEGNSFFRQLDQCYPNSKFVYNCRDMNSWLDSRSNHLEKVSEQTVLDLHKRFLDTDDMDVIRHHWKETRERYESDIRSYFHTKDNLLIIDIQDEKFVEKLSKFIDIELPLSGWKKYNKT